jgi:hypothetical protein
MHHDEQREETMKPFTHQCAAMIACAALLAAPAMALAQAKPKNSPAVPEACRPMVGVERQMCVECNDKPFYKKVGCEQRVFWTTCKGKRLINDEFCKLHQDKGPPAAVGG